MVKGWSYKHIGDLVNILNGGTPSTRVSKYWNGDINWCTPSDITKQSTKYIFSTERTITKEGLSDSGAVFLPKGTILLCTRATIGESSIAGDQICTNQGFKNLVCTAVDNEFLYYALKPLKNEMISNAHGSTFLELSKLHLEKIEVFIPNDRDEQHNIAEALSDIDELIYSLEMLIKKKKAIRKGAIQELITGKKRLKGFGEPWGEVKLNELCYLITKQTGFDYTATIQPSLSTTRASDCLPFLQTKNFRGRNFSYDTDYFIPITIAKEFPKLVLNEKSRLANGW